MKSAALASIAIALAAEPALARDLPPRETYKAMLDATKESGWLSFRDYAGKQGVYFSALQSLHCRLSEIRYSVNSKDLDQTFAVVPCNPQNPWALPPDSTPADILVEFPLGTAKTVAVQVVWDDGEESEVMVYKPCDNVGDRSCVDLAD